MIVPHWRVLHLDCFVASGGLLVTFSLEFLVTLTVI